MRSCMHCTHLNRLYLILYILKPIHHKLYPLHTVVAYDTVLLNRSARYAELCTYTVWESFKQQWLMQETQSGHMFADDNSNAHVVASQPVIAMCKFQLGQTCDNSPHRMTL